MANETPSRPPPFMANAILNFHFDYVTPSLTERGGPVIDLIHKSEILIILSANDLLATPVCNRSDQSVVVCQQVAVKPFCILDIFQD